MNRSTCLKLLLGVGSVTVLAVSAAIAGSGVGGVFNLGQTNSVNATTRLQGNSSVQLNVTNQSSAAGSVGVLGMAVETGLYGQSAGRIGVRARATGTTGTNYGLFAETASRDGYAGYFRNTASGADPLRGPAIRGLGAGATDSLFNFSRYAAGGEFAGPNGVMGIASEANQGSGVAGYSGPGHYGVAGVSTNPDGYAGFFHNRSGSTDPAKGGGIRVLAAITAGTEIPAAFYRGAGEFIGPNGVIGAASRTDGYGVFGIQGPGAFAIYASGNAHVSGTLSKGSGTFKIDHPLDPENKYLSHSFVESPDMKNFYDGIVVTGADGTAEVELPDYFEALNRDPRYQLTVIGSFAAAQVSQKVSGNRFVIRTSEPNVEVSWQVTGIRQDAFALAHPVIVEEEKAVADRGRYLHPTELGKSASMGMERLTQTASTEAH